MPERARPASPPSSGQERRTAWENFAASAFRRLVGLLLLFVVAFGVLFSSWDVAIATARLSLCLLVVLSTWLYIVWFRRQRADLSRPADDGDADPSRNYRVG